MSFFENVHEQLHSPCNAFSDVTSSWEDFFFPVSISFLKGAKQIQLRKPIFGYEKFLMFKFSFIHNLFMP